MYKKKLFRLTYWKIVFGHMSNFLLLLSFLAQKDVFLVQIGLFRRICPKKQLFGPKMTSKVKTRYNVTKDFLNRLNSVNWTTFPPTVLAKKAFKTVKTGHFCRIWPNRHLFGPNRHMSKKNFQNIPLNHLSNFLFNTFA